MHKIENAGAPRPSTYWAMASFCPLGEKFHVPGVCGSSIQFPTGAGAGAGGGGGGVVCAGAGVDVGAGAGGAGVILVMFGVAQEEGDLGPAIGAPALGCAGVDAGLRDMGKKGVEHVLESELLLPRIGGLRVVDSALPRGECLKPAGARGEGLGLFHRGKRARIGGGDACHCQKRHHRRGDRFVPHVSRV